jgi:hypothetical protein
MSVRLSVRPHVTARMSWTDCRKNYIIKLLSHGISIIIDCSSVARIRRNLIVCYGVSKMIDSGSVARIWIYCILCVGEWYKLICPEFNCVHCVAYLVETNCWTFGDEGPRSRSYGRTAALRLTVQPCDEDGEKDDLFFFIFLSFSRSLQLRHHSVAVLSVYVLFVTSPCHTTPSKRRCKPQSGLFVPLAGISERALSPAFWVLSTVGRAMALAVSRRPLTKEATVRSRVSLCGICGGQNGTGTGSSPSTSVFPCQFHSTGAPLHGKTKKLIIIIGLHNKPQGCGASVASAAGPFKKKKTGLLHVHANYKP